MVMNCSQVWAGVVPVGPCGVALNSSYANRDSAKYKEDLGCAKLDLESRVLLCRLLAIP